MNREFNNLIVQAIKRAKTAPISNVQDFARMVSSAEEQLSRIYQKNPEIDKEKTNKEMQDKLYNILHKTAEIEDVKSNISRRNAIKYLNSNWEQVEIEYRKLVAEERKTGKRLKNKERIPYSSNNKKAIRQLMVEVITNIRGIVESVDPNLIYELDRRYTGKIMDLKKELIAPFVKIVNGTIIETKTDRESRKKIERTIYLIGPIPEFEKVKYYLKKIIGQEETDKELKEQYVNAIMIIGQLIEEFGTLEEYKKHQINELKRINLEKLQDINGIDNLFKKENLQKLNLTQLAALYAFWDNRLVKEIEKIYNSYFIMYELDLDDKTTVQNKDATNKLLPQQLENLNVKTALLDSLISNIYYQYRDTHLEGGEVSIEDALSKMSAKFGADYQKYFSGICGLNVHENNFDKDIILRLKTENAIRNLYLQKDNGITGLLNLLYNGDVSENWGIIDENPRSKFVLLVSDINGLNMPLRLHIEREKVKEFAIKNQENSMVPIYSGIADFNINGRIISTHILMPLTQNQKELIKQASSNVRNGDYRYKFIKHLEYLSDWQKYPEHLQRKKITKKKGKPKIKFEKIKEYALATYNYGNLKDIVAENNVEKYIKSLL